MTKALTFAIVALAIAACQQERNISQTASSPEQKPFIDPAFDGVDVPFQTFKFDPTNDQTLVFNGPTASKIIIPKGAIIDQDGEPVKSAVTLSYREFHDAADILASGIPMEMKTQQGTEFFTTAGMFEIRAESDGKEVFIDPAKKITVRMGSYVEDSTYRFFHLDETEKNWTYQGESDPEVNKERIAMEERLEELTPKHSIPFDEGYFILNYGSMLDLLAGNDYTTIQYLQKSGSIKKKLASYNVEWLDLSLNDPVYFKGRPYPADQLVWKAVDRKPAPERPVSSSVYFVKDNIFQFNIDYGNGKRSYQLEAVMLINDLFAKDATFWEEQYQEAFAKAEEYREKLREKAAVFRTFDVAGFGIYNWDKFIQKGEEYQPNVFVDVQFNEEVPEDELSSCTFYYIGSDQRSLVRVNSGVLFNGQLNLQSNEDGLLVTSLTGGRIAVLPKQIYGSLDLTSSSESNPIQMPFTIKPGKVESVEDIRRAINS